MQSRESLPPEIPNEIFRNEDSVYHKMNSSLKKAVKIKSVCTYRLKLNRFSRKPPQRSPTKQQNRKTPEQLNYQPNNNNNHMHYQNPFLNTNPYPKNQETISGFSTNHQGTKIIKKNTFNFQNPSNNSTNSRHQENIQQIKFKRNNTVQESPNSFFQTVEQQRYSNMNNCPQNPSQISQIIDKEAESEINNQSLTEISFLTGNRDQNSRSSKVFTPDSLQSMMNLMKEQIWIAKENSEKRFHAILKDHSITIQKINTKLMQSQAIIKEKTNQIERLKVRVMESNNYSKASNAQGIHSTNAGSPHGVVPFIEQKISDLESKLFVISKSIAQSNKNSNYSFISNKNIEKFEKDIITFFSYKLSTTKSDLSCYLKQNSQKLTQCFHICDNVIENFQKIKAEFSKSKISENQIKKIVHTQQELKEDCTSFQHKEFKYENFTIEPLKQSLENLKEKIRGMESVQYENGKIFKHLMTKYSKLSQRSKPKSPIKQYSRYFKDSQNPNHSNSYNDSFNDTKSYSHLLEKLNPNETSENENISSSLISMNFSDPSQSVDIQQQQNNQQKVHQVQYRHHQMGHEQNQGDEFDMSKLTKVTKATVNLKETTTMFQEHPVSPLTHQVATMVTNNSHNSPNFYVPNTKQKSNNKKSHPHPYPQSSSLIKIKNLQDLKMQSIIQTPQKHPLNPNPHKKLDKSLTNHNNSSFFSISQLDDYQPNSPINQTQDFGDDEFFYPGNGINDSTYSKKYEQYIYNSPSKSYSRHTEKTIEEQQFSPFKDKKMMSTHQQFYQNNNDDERRKEQQQPMYNSSFDYEKFSEDEEDEPKDHSNANGKVNTSPFPSMQKVKSNEINTNKLRTELLRLKREELPVRGVYDSRKRELMIKTPNNRHYLFGKVFPCDPKELEILSKENLIYIGTTI